VAEPNYSIPPWIYGADPAAQYARGLGIGADIGQAQQRTALAQQSAMREQAQQAVEDAYRQQKFQLESDEAARKLAAQIRIEKAIEGGMEPQRAYLLYGAQAGLTSLPQLAKPAISPFQEAELRRWSTQDADRARQAEATAKFRQDLLDLRRRTKPATLHLEPKPGSEEQGTLTGSVNDPAVQARLALRAREATKAGEPNWAANYLHYLLGGPSEVVAGGLKSLIGGEPGTEAEAEEITGTLDDGRKAVFDARTKKFLRYADQPGTAQLGTDTGISTESDSDTESEDESE